MITFHNDHLVSPTFCEIIYSTIPVKHHIPVIFHAHTKKLGLFGNTDARVVNLYLSNHFYRNYPGEFDLWLGLLRTTYHEFGHIATYPAWRHLEAAYDLKGSEYLEIENLADEWAIRALDNLAEFDRRICQPSRLGPYFDGRIVQRKKKLRAMKSAVLLDEWRRFKSGGQLSASEVAQYCEAYYYPTYETGRRKVPDTKLISRLAADLAYEYIDRIGRIHRFFAWGDREEIKKRVTRYRAIHGPTRSEIEFKEQRLAEGYIFPGGDLEETTEYNTPLIRTKTALALETAGGQ